MIAPVLGYDKGMTKQLFEATARILADNKASLSIALDFMRLFEEANPRFDPKRFLTAAGHGEWAEEFLD